MADAAVALAVDADNPWPGLEAFTEGAAAYFHGREDEAAELLERVKSRGLTVLYGQSGLGKTSLLQAGLFPRLRRDGFLPVYVRLDFAAGAPPLGEQMMRQAARTINDATLDATFRLEDETSLWRWLHRRDGDLCDLRGREITPVIVVDQFEEISRWARSRPTRRRVSWPSSATSSRTACRRSSRLPSSATRRWRRSTTSTAGPTGCC